MITSIFLHHYWLLWFLSHCFCSYNLHFVSSVLRSHLKTCRITVFSYTRNFTENFVQQSPHSPTVASFLFTALQIPLKANKHYILQHYKKSNTPRILFLVTEYSLKYPIPLHYHSLPTDKELVTLIRYNHLPSSSHNQKKNKIKHNL